jgi:cobalt transporter subunit CbtB
MSTHHAVIGQVGSPSQSSLWKDKILPFLMAGGLGVVLLYGAAFAETEALHNAAHDSRHSASFPCH